MKPRIGLLVASLLLATPARALTLDDASHMSATSLVTTLDVPADSAAAERALVAFLADARARKLPVSIGGARHTMGGQTLVEGGAFVNMLPHDRLALDGDVLHVGAGSRWAKVVPYLDQRGFSPWVMQSNNDFTVGGSLGANCHGWQVNRPPIASSVLGFTLLTADGKLRRCSRTENRELFGCVLGGYGLFGVVLDVDLKVIPNERYLLSREFMAPEAYPAAFARRVAGHGEVGMAYGRLSIAPGSFLREAILNVFTKHPGEPMPALAPDPANPLKRQLFFASGREAYWKELRWGAEKLLEPELSTSYVNRNQLFDESADVYADPDPSQTAILQEYFVPRARFAEFVAKARAIIPAHRGNLLNLTIRDVTRDDDACLRYADQDMFALVMYFKQSRDAAGEARMTGMARGLVDAAIAAGGRYYLPYRLQATLGQFHRAYPQAPRFFDLKRKYDPEGLFQNAFSRRYGETVTSLVSPP